MPIASETLKLYLNSVFIETGTFRGDGTAAALEAGFHKVYTIEAHPELYRNAAQRFQHDPRVTCYFGSSIEHIPNILPTLTEPATFWLDSHTCGGATAGAWACPLMEELRQLAILSSIKNHTILIDDVHLFGFELPGLPEIKQRLANINPEYTLSYLPSADPSLGEDILLATTLHL